MNLEERIADSLQQGRTDLLGEQLRPRCEHLLQVAVLSLGCIPFALLIHHQLDRGSFGEDRMVADLFPSIDVLTTGFLSTLKLIDETLLSLVRLLQRRGIVQSTLMVLCTEEPISDLPINRLIYPKAALRSVLPCIVHNLIYSNQIIPDSQ